MKEENHNFRIYLHLLSVISLTAHVLFGHLVVYRLSKCVNVAQATHECTSKYKEKNFEDRIWVFCIYVYFKTIYCIGSGEVECHGEFYTFSIITFQLHSSVKMRVTDCQQK